VTANASRGGYKMATLPDGKRVKVVEFNGILGHEVAWTDSCSGCYETNEGYAPAGAPFDEKANCHLGSGCHECGYTGKRRSVAWVPLDAEMDKYEAAMERCGWTMRPDHYEILVGDPRPRIVRVRSIAGMDRSGALVFFWGAWRYHLGIFFPHRPELPANPMERRR
jgi:hypothetical protein